MTYFPQLWATFYGPAFINLTPRPPVEGVDAAMICAHAS